MRSPSAFPSLLSVNDHEAATDEHNSADERIWKGRMMILKVYVE